VPTGALGAFRRRYFFFGFFGAFFRLPAVPCCGRHVSDGAELDW
jgi:hypothetical protein